MGNSLSKEVECEKCLIYENKCKEYERHIQNINESHLEWRDLSEELRKEEVECVENFYIERLKMISDAAVKVIKEERSKNSVLLAEPQAIK